MSFCKIEAITTRTDADVVSKMRPCPATGSQMFRPQGAGPVGPWAGVPHSKCHPNKEQVLCEIFNGISYNSGRSVVYSSPAKTSQQWGTSIRDSASPICLPILYEHSWIRIIVCIPTTFESLFLGNMTIANTL